MASHDSDLLTLIPLSASTVLHASRGDGSLAAAYRALNPRARLLRLVLEPAADVLTAADPEAAERWCLAQPAGVPEAAAADDIDCIIYDEVLEHLADPWTTLREHAARLAPDGVVLIRARNASHWRLAEAVLRGGSALGLMQGLDPDTMARELASCDLFPADVVADEAEPEAARRFAEAMAPALLGLGVDPERYRERCQGSYRIWRACRSPVRHLRVLGSMLNPVGGVSHVRVVHPLQALASEPGLRTGITDRVQPLPAEMPGIFVLHRPALMGAAGLRVLTTLAEAGYVIITEFDDLPDHFPMMRNGGELTFVGVHAVQTSTAPLAEELRKYNPQVAVYPNALVSLPEPVNFTDPYAVTVFFGALNREQDWAPLMPVINDVAALMGERLKFQVVHDRSFFQALKTPFKAFTPTCDYETYQQLLAGSEISFMPLGDTAFNRAKSDLKFIEAASYRVASLASPVVYEATIKHGETGLIFRDAEDLWQGLMGLVDRPGYTRRLAEAARDYVATERMMAYQVGSRIAWYRRLWDQREVLEHERRRRLARYAGLTV